MIDSPDYAIRDNIEKHRFEADLGDGSAAIADYLLGEGTMVFTHTEVPSAHAGHGIGTALVRFALREARNRGLLVVPLCPFFAAYIDQHGEEQDLLDPDWRRTAG